MNKASVFVILMIVLAVAFWMVWGQGNPTTSSAPVAQSDAYSTSTPSTSIDATSTIPVSTPVTTNPTNNMHRVTIETSLGTIQFETYDADAPKTVENFITLANKGYYNGVIFHRVIPGFMIQGGDPTGTGTGGPGYAFEDELNPQTPSYKAGYDRGVVAMANAGPNTNGSQFFIMHQDYPLPNNYTIFGKVVKGIEVVDKIANVPRNSNDKPNQNVTMTKVTVEEVK